RPETVRAASPCPWPAMPSKRTSADYPSPHLRIRSSTDSFVPESINLCRGSLSGHRRFSRSNAEPYSHSGLLEAREQERHFGGAKNILGGEHMRRDNFDFRLAV